MLSDVEHVEKKQQILRSCFALFVQQGLENTSMNDLIQYCNTYKAAMYSYFRSKDEIVIECAKMYMEELDEKLHSSVASAKNSLTEEFEESFVYLTQEKNKLRFVYQVVSSPKYGEVSRKELATIYIKYLDYSIEIAKKYDVEHEKLRPYYLLFVATVHDFCLWENEPLVSERLNYIYERLANLKVA